MVVGFPDSASRATFSLSLNKAMSLVIDIIVDCSLQQLAICTIASTTAERVLLAGDLFNTALPRVDALKFVTRELKRLQEKNIPVSNLY